MKTIPYRIRLGIMPHRSSDSFAPLSKEALNAVLGLDYWNEYKKIQLNSLFTFFDPQAEMALRNATQTPVAFTVLSSLGDPASQAICTQLMAIPDTSLEVVLPFSIADYKQQLRKEEIIAQFEALMSKDPSIYRIITSPGSTTSAGMVDVEGAYQLSERYLADHCDVLVVFENGDNRLWLDYAEKRKLPCILLPASPADQIQFFQGNGIRAATIERLNYFNAFDPPDEALQSYTENATNHYLGKQPEMHDAWGAEEAVKKQLFPFYAKTSLLAKRHKKRYEQAGLWAYRLATISVLTVAIGLLYKPLYHFVFLLELVLLTIIFMIVFYADRQKSHRNWIENRFLAERLRFASYFFITGQEISQLHTNPYHERASHEGWITHIFQEVWECLLKEKTEALSLPEKKTFISKALLDDQLGYHQKKHKDMEFKNRLYERMGFTVYGTAILAALLHSIPYYLWHIVYPVWCDKILTFLAIALPATGAMIEGVRRIREYSRNAKRSESMVTALNILKEKFQYIETEAEFATMMKETDLLLLRENQEWMLMRTVLELEPVV